MIHHLPPTDNWPVRLLRLRWRLEDTPRQARRALARVGAGFYRFIDTRLSPAIQAYATHRLHIALMVALWAALLVCGGWTAFELTGGNYTNGLSGLLTCVILLQQQKHHRETTARHDSHADQLAALHAKVDALASTTPPATPTSDAAPVAAKPRKRALNDPRATV